MWQAILKQVLKFAITKFPWEQITAIFLSLALKWLSTQKPDEYDRAKRLAEKLSDQLAVLCAAIEDDKITQEEAQTLLDAWADRMPTPHKVEEKVFA